LAHLQFPDTARADTGVRAGDTISPWYDPMIAKLTVHGSTRALALRKLADALARTEIAGSVTNLAFLRALALHRGFAAGKVDTGLIARDLAALVSDPEPCSRTKALASAAAAGLDARMSAQGFTLWAPLAQDIALLHADTPVPARVAHTGPGQGRVELGEISHSVEVSDTGWCVDGAPVPARVVRHAAGLSVFWGNGYHFTQPDPLEKAPEADSGSDLVEAPMPGLVKAVFVAPGAKVEAGARLAVLEAMKMEHTLSAARDGVVAEVFVADGAQVDAGAALIRLEGPDDAMT
ncbi:MAG: biotin/lipoyl-containing protein, partial [Pseudomonadota bacterium]